MLIIEGAAICFKWHHQEMARGKIKIRLNQNISRAFLLIQQNGVQKLVVFYIILFYIYIYENLNVILRFSRKIITRKAIFIISEKYILK